MATEFGKILRIIRINTGDTSKLMAEKLGVSIPYLNAIENGKRDIPFEFEKKINEKYFLSKKDKEALHEAIIKGKDSLKIDLAEFDDTTKRIIISLVKDDIDKETLSQVLNIITESKGKNKR